MPVNHSFSKPLLVLDGRREKLIYNHMGYAKGNHYLQEMREAHNERVLYQDIMNANFMPAERLAECQAAYSMPRIDSSPASRLELYQQLSKGGRPWNKYKLLQHRQRVGGTGASFEPRGARSVQ